MNHHSKQLGAVLLAALLSVACGQDRREAVIDEQVANQLKTGEALVSVVLDAPEERQLKIKSALARVLRKSGSEVVHSFGRVPGMSLVLKNEASLESLRNDPHVLRVDLDIAGEAGLVQSAQSIGIDGAFRRDVGVRGAGRKVVILDTGVRADHPDLADDLVGGACVCSTNFTDDFCCTSGTHGISSAFDDSGHGTHVSGIVTSKGTVAPRGIAPDADVVVVRVMNNNRFNSTGDIVAGLEWVLNNHPDADAVNMSLGTFATFPANCDQGDSVPAYIQNLSTAVQNLRDAGVVVVASSGNNGTKDAMQAPACLHNVVSVGATYKYEAEKTTVAGFSNASSGLSLYAPGVSVESSGLYFDTDIMSGTSMASPHVAAAVALVREVGPTRSATAAIACLLQSPTQVTESVGGAPQSRPLLHVPTAVAACNDELPPIDPPVDPPVDPPTDPPPAAEGCSKHVSVLASGDVKFALTLPTRQSYVEVFVRSNGIQTVAQNIAASEVENGDGSFSYSLVRPAWEYQVGDVIQARFYHYAAGQPGYFTPGPSEAAWADDFIYGDGAVCEIFPTCHPSIKQLSSGDVLFAVTFESPQSYVEVFGQQNGLQNVAQNIVDSATTNDDGTVTYRFIRPAHSFQSGDEITTRFYSYASGQPGVFTPGPVEQSWSPEFVYDQSCL